MHALQRKLEEQAEKKADKLHALAAPIFATILDALPSQLSAAALLRETEQHVSDKRSGARGVAGWEVFALLASDRNAWLAFARLFCELHDCEPVKARQRVTREDLKEDLLQVALENQIVMDALIKKAREKHGADPGDVFLGLALP